MLPFQRRFSNKLLFEKKEEEITIQNRKKEIKEKMKAKRRTERVKDVIHCGISVAFI